MNYRRRMNTATSAFDILNPATVSIVNDFDGSSNSSSSSGALRNLNKFVCKYDMEVLKLLLSLHSEPPSVGNKISGGFMGIYTAESPVIYVNRVQQEQASKDFEKCFEECWRPFLEKCFQWLHCVGLIIYYLEWREDFQDWVPQMIDPTKGRLISLYDNFTKKKQYIWQQFVMGNGFASLHQEDALNTSIRYDPNVKIYVFYEPDDTVEDNTMFLKNYTDQIILGSANHGQPIPFNTMMHKSQFRSPWSRVLMEKFRVDRITAAQLRIFELQARPTVYIKHNLSFKGDEIENMLAIYRPPGSTREEFQKDLGMRRLFTDIIGPSKDRVKVNKKAFSSMLASDFLHGDAMLDVAPLENNVNAARAVRRELDPRNEISSEEFSDAMTNLYRSSTGLFEPPIRIQGTDNYMLGLSQEPIFPTRPPSIDTSVFDMNWEAHIGDVYGVPINRFRLTGHINEKGLEELEDQTKHSFESIAGRLENAMATIMKEIRGLHVDNSLNDLKNFRTQYQRKQNRKRRLSTANATDADPSSEEGGEEDDGGGNEDDNDEGGENDDETQKKIASYHLELNEIKSASLEIKFSPTYRIDVINLITLMDKGIGDPNEWLSIIKQQFKIPDVGSSKPMQRQQSSSSSSSNKRKTDPKKEKTKQTDKEDEEEEEEEDEEDEDEDTKEKKEKKKENEKGKEKKKEPEKKKESDKEKKDTDKEKKESEKESEKKKDTDKESEKKKDSDKEKKDTEKEKKDTEKEKKDSEKKKGSKEKEEEEPKKKKRK